MRNSSLVALKTVNGVKLFLASVILSIAGVVYHSPSIHAQCQTQYLIAASSLQHSGVRALGRSMATAGDVNGDGYLDIIAGAPWADGDEIGDFTGRAFVFSGVDGTLLYEYAGTGAEEFLGVSVSGAGDINGDGYDDFMIGGENRSATTGGVDVYSGIDGSVLFSFVDGELVDLGLAIAGGQDANGDGIPDFILGGRHVMAVQVRSGADGSMLYRFTPEAYTGHYSQDVAWAGDVNNDGYADIIVGSYTYKDEEGIYRGKAYVYSGADGSLLHSFIGTGENINFSSHVEGVGDLNLDGFDDIAVTEFGKIYLFSGADGSTLYTITRRDARFWVGSIAVTADYDLDGVNDLLVGSVGPQNERTVFIFSGATGIPLFIHRDVLEGNVMYGSSVAPIGDINGDGIADFATSASIPEETFQTESFGGVLTETVSVDACCCSQVGDLNHDNKTSISDATFGIATIFKGGALPYCSQEADTNDDGSLNIADITTIIAYIFAGGTMADCSL